MREHELILAGQRYALDPTHTESLNEVCNHGGSSFSGVRPLRTEHEHNPQPKENDSEIVAPENEIKNEE